MGKTDETQSARKSDKGSFFEKNLSFLKEKGILPEYAKAEKLSLSHLHEVGEGISGCKIQKIKKSNRSYDKKH